MTFINLQGKGKFFLISSIGVIAIIAGAFYFRFLAVTRIDPEPIFEAREAVNERYITEERQRAFDKFQQALYAMPDTAPRPEWIDTSTISSGIYNETKGWRKDWARSFSLAKDAIKLSETLYIPFQLPSQGVEKVEIRARNLSYALSVEAYRKASTGKIDGVLEYVDLAMWVGTGLAKGERLDAMMSEMCRAYTMHILLLTLIEEDVELEDIARVRDTILRYGKKDVWAHNLTEEMLKLRLRLTTAREVAWIAESGSFWDKLWLAIMGKNGVKRKVESSWKRYKKWGNISWAEVLKDRRDVFTGVPKWFPTDDWPPVSWDENAFEIDGAERRVMRDTLSLILSQYKDDTRFSLLEAILAVEMYLKEHGKPPKRLDALVPIHLETIPGDPFSGEKLIFRKKENGYLIYSVGPNGIDNGGIIKGKENIAIGVEKANKKWFDVSKDFVVNRPPIDN